jgi:cytochrome b
MKDANDTIRVWDPIVRIGHWTLAIAFFTAYLTEDDFLTQHAWAGYAVGTIVCVRLLWGFIGTRYAKFTDFVRSPTETLQYIASLASNSSKRYIGHNPAAGAMIIALLLSVSGTVFSGLVVYAIEEKAGPLATWVAENSAPAPSFTFINSAYADNDEDEHGGSGAHEDDAFEEFWEEAHEILANFTLLLIVLHIAGVLYSSYLHKENLIRGMFSGLKRRSVD